ncbi:MAG: YHS domain-containing protein [Sphingopyxis sp.]|nr:YHS domain-containing protein [Sphingopyxis sp.]
MKLTHVLAAALSVATISGPLVVAASASGTQSAAVAVRGYDLVSFFEKGFAPVVGNARFAVVHGGKRYHFASQANADAFKANPAAYLPLYGGHCAWAASEGYIAPGDPRYATVVNGKLYFNYNADVLATWKKDVPGHIAKADRNWPKLAKRAG